MTHEIRGRLYLRFQAIHPGIGAIRPSLGLGLAFQDKFHGPLNIHRHEAIIAFFHLGNVFRIIPIVPMIGQTISHYRIIGKLGSGGMGVVYKAEDTNLDRAVALKFLAAHLLESEEHKQRFLREAKAAASLDHPNICTVYEIGEADGHVFLAMGFVDGQEVRAKIKERPLKLDEALDIAIQAGDGLRAAHQKGIVHRDIKSSNLMQTSSGQVKIMDFGLAQLTGGSRLTKTDAMLGTAAYMSPEQAQRLSTDERTDIWSLGVVLYEMVTGRLPFAGEREQAVLYSIINEPHEPVTAVRVGVPTEFDRIIGKALAKKPEERYQHLDDVLVDVRALRGQVVPAAGRTQPRRWAWVALPPVLLLAGFFARDLWRQSQPAPPVRAEALTTYPGQELYPSFSPDGDHVTFTWTGPRQDNTDVYVQQIGSAGSPLRLTADPHSDYNPVWSPDGRWIAFLRHESARPDSLWNGNGNNELRVIPPLGGPERMLCEVRIREHHVITPYITWCPDSNCLIVSDSPGEGKPDALFVVAFDTGEKRQLTSPLSPVLGDSNPAVSPDGRSLVFRRNLSDAGGELRWLPLGKGVVAAGEVVRVKVPALNAATPAWIDSKEVIFSDRASLWRVASPFLDAPARLPFVGEDGLMPAVSRAQPGRPLRLVYVRSTDDFNLWRIQTSAPGGAAASPPAMLISSTRRDWNAQFSPDGRRIAFQSTRSGFWEIWLADPDGGNAVQLTSMGAPLTGTARWSPDGRTIAFHSNPDGPLDIFVIPSSGGKPSRLTSHPATDQVPSFSQDGKWIYFSSNRTGDYQIWKMPAKGGDAVQVTNNGGYTAFESPDGADLYYTQTSFSASSLWRLPVAGGRPVKLLEGVVSRAFSVLQSGIYYIDRPDSEARLQFFDFSKGRPAIVAAGLGAIQMGLTASPDGRTILFSRVDSSPSDLMLVENFR